MKILICGFYGHKNLGDDFFQVSLNLLLEGNELTYNELSKIDTIDLSLYDVIIIGGGDLMNDFYGIKYEEVLSKYQGYKIALGVGFSFEECTRRNYVNYFDDIIIRNKRDLLQVSKIVGSFNCHYLSDITFTIPLSLNFDNKSNRNVGLLLVGSYVNNLSFLFPLLSLINWIITLDYNIYLIPMYAEKGEGIDNDNSINDFIYKTFSHTNKVFIYEELTTESFLNIMSDIDYAICMRFHGHIFCTRFGIPFLSIPITRKTEIYIDELPYDCNQKVNLFFDRKYNVISFDLEDSKRKFKNIIDNGHNIKEELLYYDSICRNEHDKIKKLLENKIKRKISPIDVILLNPETIYEKYLRILTDQGINIFSDKCIDMVSQKWIHNIADDLCYEMTKDPANDYIYGTRDNFENNIDKLRDMIYYIHHDFLNKLSIPKININYIKQDSFKGLHRAGWQYAIDSFYCLSGDHGVFLDTYLDRTFGWASNIFLNSGILPYTNKWIGFFHHTFDETFSENNLTNIFKNKLFLDSLPLCIGIFCLTEYLAKLVRKKLNEFGYTFNVRALHHPTIFTNKMFNYESFMSNKKIVNVGSWYLNPITINILSMRYTGDYRFASLFGKRMSGNFCPDTFTILYRDDKYICEDSVWTKYFIKYVSEEKDDFSINFMKKLDKNNTLINKDDLMELIGNVEIIKELDNEGYDNLLTNSIVFLDLIDASVANTIIECIVRNTPILINRIEPTIELLGDDYPLFYNNLDEAIDLINDEKILETSEYMKRLDKDIYRIDNFIQSFVESDIYKSI